MFDEIHSPNSPSASCSDIALKIKLPTSNQNVGKVAIKSRPTVQIYSRTKFSYATCDLNQITRTLIGRKGDIKFVKYGTCLLCYSLSLSHFNWINEKQCCGWYYSTWSTSTLLGDLHSAQIMPCPTTSCFTRLSRSRRGKKSITFLH